jgi:hypothetical protein
MVATLAPSCTATLAIRTVGSNRIMTRIAGLPGSIAVLLVACCASSVLAGAAMASTNAAGGIADQAARWVDEALVHGRQFLTLFADWLTAGSTQFPVIMIGLSSIVVLPVVALLGWLFLARERGGGPEPKVPTVEVLPRSAWMRIEGEGQRRMAIEREIVQIGRDADNDICLGDSTVHRYHAVIERLPDTGYFITDLSGPNGHGVRVNGRRTARAWLTSGDVVQIGRSRMRFETAA